MNKYKIFETKEFRKKFEIIPAKERLLIETKLLSQIYPQLREEPHYGNNIKKLVSYKPETWRYRIGKYRFFYFIDEKEKIVYVLTIALRKEAY